ncbi:hypothetical protein [Hydrogenophaga sp. 5NK40-0174]|uniref:hypothetical protein n=1 Tax=Hydrogenophaga sp. 5NK40-0174 TaxID=3127649 RepID=UPI003341A474
MRQASPLTSVETTSGEVPAQAPVAAMVLGFVQAPTTTQTIAAALTLTERR